MRAMGCHLSTSKGYAGMAREALRIGASCFQFFTRNPRGARARDLDPDDIAAFLQLAEEHGIGPILGHAAYTLNPATTDGHKAAFAREIMADDLERLERTPGALYVFHPGRHPQPDSDEAVNRVAETLNAVLRADMSTTVLLETMAGHATEVGSRFETLGAVIDAAEHKERLGVCLDTCHVFAAGYDIARDLDGVLRRFDEMVGLDRLYALHCNDSKYPLASGMDRHANIGEGFLGLETFRNIVNHPLLRDVPLYLETPGREAGTDNFAREIKLLRSLEEKTGYSGL